MAASPQKPADSYPRLLGDIGGTHARFAMQTAAGGPLTEPRTLRCREYPGPAEAISAYLAQNALPSPRWAAFGIATALSGDVIEMTNHSWQFSVQALLRTLGLKRLCFVNDFTALALSLPVLPPTELVRIGGGTIVPGFPIAVIGPGTGLGVSGLIPASHGYLPLSGEGGHVTLAASTPRESLLIDTIRQRHPHVSAERVLSGPGLVTLTQAIAGLAGVDLGTLSPPDILERGMSGTCAYCGEALDMFCAMLGTVASDLALTLGARSGVYIGGGIVQRLGSFFEQSGFRQRFESKGRFRGYLAAIPTFAIMAPWPGILGAGRALEMDDLTFALEAHQT